MEQYEDVRQECWAASRRAEEQGDLGRALEIHLDLMCEDVPSYAVLVRAGYLYFELGLYEVALRYYELACSVSNEDWPLGGIKRCLIALGEIDTLAEIGELVHGADETRPSLCVDTRPNGPIE